MRDGFRIGYPELRWCGNILSYEGPFHMWDAETEEEQKEAEKEIARFEF